MELIIFCQAWFDKIAKQSKLVSSEILLVNLNIKIIFGSSNCSKIFQNVSYKFKILWEIFIQKNKNKIKIQNHKN